MKNIFTLSLAVVTALASFTGCKKEGCNDPDATNYDVDAGKDDGSCIFEGSVVFWYNAATADFMQSLGVDELNFYVDGNLVGTRNINDFYTTQPDCGDAGSITVVKSLDDKKSRNSRSPLKIKRTSCSMLESSASVRMNVRPSVSTDSRCV